VINLVVLVLLVIHQFLQLLAKQVNLAQVKWTKIRKKWLVDEIIVNAKVESVLAGLGWVLIANPVKTARNNLHRLIGVCVALASSSPSFMTCLSHDGDMLSQRCLTNKCPTKN
jgi:hypothetical protein